MDKKFVLYKSQGVLGGARKKLTKASALLEEARSTEEDAERDRLARRARVLVHEARTLQDFARAGE